MSTYDLKGNRTTDETRDPTNALKRAVTYTYDLRNRLDTINAAGSVTDLLFDRLGNLKHEVDANSNATTHTYDALNRAQQTTDALTGITSYGYDNQSNLIQVLAPNGATTTYVYDDLGNLLEQSSPDTGLATYAYDAAGNRTSATDARGIVTTFSYDALNRLQNRAYPNSSLNQAFIYDGGVAQKGRLRGWTDASGATTNSFDLYGGRTGSTRTVAGTSFTTAYGYDNGGRVTTMTYPSSARTVTYTRNVLGQVTQVSTTLNGTTTVLADQFQYLPFGPVRAYTLGNGVVTTRSHDQQYRLTSLLDSGGSPVRDRAYTYDAGGNIDRIQDTLASVDTQDFAQDALNRITSDASNYGVVSYQYDPVGNRTQRMRGAVTEQTITYTASSNRLNQLNSVAYSYDAAGSTLADGPGNRTFTYDDTGRLTQARVAGVLKGTYLYNADGQRVRRIEVTGAQRTSFYHYGLAGELLAETLFNSSAQKLAEREYIWVDGLPLAFAERSFDPATGSVFATQLIYLHADHLGTPRLATDGAQRVVWRWSSDAFGIGAAENDPDGDTINAFVGIRFAGQFFDDETSLHYNYYRDYDPKTGRYVQSDPIGLEGGLNTYTYANSNPVSFTDPLGLDAVPRPGIPVVIPPAFVPGTPEYNDLVDSGSRFLEDLMRPIMETSPGNVADTQIKQDYEKYASAERLCGKEPKDRCTWLDENKSRYRADQVKATQKAWGCRRSRALR